ncbi:MAG: hypothetical protein IK020_05695 [Clostridiales bacterium]|nr:hypothetical protein [Clostridiales bacterium]
MTQRPFDASQWEETGKIKGFWRSYARDWGKVCGCNALLMGVNMLSFVIGICLVMFLLPLIFTSFTPAGLKDFILETEMVEATSVTDEAVENIFYTLCMLSSFFMIGMLLVVNGPFYSAVSFYFRNLITGEGDFRVDFKKGLKENWKKSLAASILSIVVTVVILFNIGYYQRAEMGTLSLAAKSFFTVLLSFWCWIQLFVYPLIACVELSFKEVYRNAVIMSVKNFPVVIGVFFLQIILFGVIPYGLMFSFGTIGYAITMLLYMIFSFGFLSYVAMYITWKAIQKIIQSQ